ITWAGDCDNIRSIAQHTLALAIRDLLVSDHYASGAHGDGTRDIKCYAQDPVYTLVDEQILYEAGFTVVDDPRAFLEVDEASVVIAISPDIPVRQIVADIARPTIMIWDKVTVLDRDIAWHVYFSLTDPVSSRVEQMMEEYIELPFPAEDKYFDDVVMYVRKGG
ncbi:hypothetical protein C8A00DRAFT_16789, partial [Chaetomidium leptoderma]